MQSVGLSTVEMASGGAKSFAELTRNWTHQAVTANMNAMRFVARKSADTGTREDLVFSHQDVS
jgi:hypothetical protein